MSRIIPIILSGGAGARLWPVSRRMHPKPFMEVAGKPLLAHALARAALVADEAVIVTNQDHYFLTENLLKENDGYAGLAASLENIYIVGSIVVDELLDNWDRYSVSVPGTSNSADVNTQQ